MDRIFGLTLALLIGCHAKGPDRAAPACVEARCEADAAPLECERDEQCELGLVCIDGGCGSCSDPNQCASKQCNPSGRCEPLPCALDDECPVEQICDGGQCVHTASGDEPGACGIATIYFASDSAKLSPNNQEQLSRATPCLVELLESGGELILESHADNLGGEPYSLALAEQRGTTVLEFLAHMGVPAERMRVTNKGALEADGARDRRVKIIHVAP